MSWQCMTRSRVTRVKNVMKLQVMSITCINMFCLCMRRLRDTAARYVKLDLHLYLNLIGISRSMKVFRNRNHKKSVMNKCLVTGCGRVRKFCPHLTHSSLHLEWDAATSLLASIRSFRISSVNSLRSLVEICL